MTATYSSFSLFDVDVNDVDVVAVSSAKLCKMFGVKRVARLLESILVPVSIVPERIKQAALG